MAEWIQPMDYAHATSQPRLQVPVQSDLCFGHHPLRDEIHLKARASDTCQVDYRGRRAKGPERYCPRNNFSDEPWETDVV